MKKTLLTLLLLSAIPCLHAIHRVDSLLKVLDATIAERQVYADRKEARINDLILEKAKLRSLEEMYRINQQIIGEFESFTCDLAEEYIRENIEIARELGNREYLTESSLRLGFVYSLSGLFVQANGIFEAVDYDSLPTHLKLAYCWNNIRYYENLQRYTDDPKFSDGYTAQVCWLREALLGLLNPASDEYRKEMAFKYQSEGEYGQAIGILSEIFDKQQSETHSFAMSAMSLAKVYRLAGDRRQENYYLLLAAITDTKLAVKENEALLVLAMNLFEEGDIKRSYNYISAALSDANFYNSRFRNTVIARVQPVIESNYLYRIENQRRNLRLYATLISIFLVGLIIMSYINFRQIKIVTKARRHLRAMNDKLVAMNRKLDESNLIKEKYIGYFMNQCAVYINKLDTYRKEVNHKIKNGQVDRIYKSSAIELEKEVEELYANFDEAFLKLYPDFVDQFNSLLKPGERYTIDKQRLNPEVRIYALIRLGITDVSQIAVFLRYSVQTIYNYKSKVKAKALGGGGSLEDEVKKLGSLTFTPESE
ncbi:MAG: DUF6377 domain-containing protein [Alistipes sp.]|nr:DUF6377 domain-containing protein [Alistipes sp.]